MRIGVISDLHCGDPRRGLTAPGVIRRFARGLKKKHLDAIVLAGDAGEPLFRFTEALDIFIDLGVPVAVLPGNHDVWSTREHSSQDLLEHLLPAKTAKRGFTWLETKNLYLRDSGVAIAGSMAWYDYSACLPGMPGLFGNIGGHLQQRNNRPIQLFPAFVSRYLLFPGLLPAYFPV